MSAADSAATSGDTPQPAKTGGVIPILLVAAFVVILNETVMNVAIRSIIDDLHVQEHDGQWLTTAFMLTMAVIIPMTGWLLQHLSTRGAFLLAMSLFTSGTAIAALSAPAAALLAGADPSAVSWAFPILVLGRIVQASGTAIMMPLLMTTVMNLVPPDERGRIMGRISLVIAVAPAIGPTISGLVLAILPWPFIFVVMLPIAGAMLAFGALRLVSVPSERDHHPLDPLSVVLSALGFGGLVVTLSLAGGDTPFAVAVSGAAAAVGIAAFVWRQFVLQRTDAAMLDLRCFGSRTFSTAVGMMALAMMALFGTIILLPLLLQKAYGLEPLQVGLMLLPGGIIMGALGPTVGRLYDRVGPRPILVPGTILVGLVLAGLSLIRPETPWWGFLVAHLCLSLGLAGVFTPLFTASLGALPRKRYSHGSAIVGTVQQLAGAIGTALFVSIMVAGGGGGADADPSAAGMIHGSSIAFLVAAVAWAPVIVLALTLRRPDGGPVPSE